MNAVQVNITNPFGCDWSIFHNAVSDIWVRCDSHLGGKFLDSEALIEKIVNLLHSCANDDERLRTRFAEMVKGLNGSYAIILKATDRVFVAVDHMRSIPLFYGWLQGRLLISDSAEAARRYVGASPIDRRAAVEFILAGYVTGNRTLFKQVKQVEPGDALLFRANTTTPLKISGQPSLMDSVKDVLADRGLNESLYAVLRDAFMRLLDSTGGARFIVPLSDGYDSRLILHMLNNLGKKDVLCISYGRPRTALIRSARQTARTYGYPWLFIRYSRRLWRQSLASDEIKALEPAAHNCCSVPHIQDFPAFLALKQRNLLRVNDVILPGHTTAMYLKGTDGVGSAETAAEAILKKHFSLWDWSLKSRAILSVLKPRITRQLLENGPIETAADALRALEHWELRERQAKFIVNSVRTYEFFGCRWRLPLWDKALVQYWHQLPIEARKGKEPIRRLLDGKPDRARSRQRVTGWQKHFPIFKARLKKWPVCYHLINKLDFRRYAILSFWKNSILFYGAENFTFFWFAYHDSLNAYSLYLKRFFAETYGDDSILELTRFFTRQFPSDSNVQR